MALGLVKRPTNPHSAPPVRQFIQATQEPAAPKNAPAHKFTARQALFMDHWMVSRNATQAAIAAGYSGKTAYSSGQRLLKQVEIKGELDRRAGKQADKLEVSADRVVREVAKIAFSDMGRFLGADGLPLTDFSKLDPDDTAAIHSITVEEFKDGRSDKREVRRFKFSLHDKVKGLDLLMQKLGLKVEKHEHKHDVTIIGMLLSEIDQESRGKVIEHEKLDTPAR
ncbi:MAG TPA: terminase small subunit [Xanthobacteraceae bacterium]|nr:terminase small subunit [Xanthobacteraceae bacterium]